MIASRLIVTVLLVATASLAPTSGVAQPRVAQPRVAQPREDSLRSAGDSVRALATRAERLYAAGQIDAAVRLLDSARRRCKAAGDTDGGGRIAYVAAEMLRRQSRDTEAREEFSRSLERMEREHDSLGVAWAWRRLGDLCLLHDDDGCAMDHYRNALGRFLTCGDAAGRAGALAAIGKVALGRGAHAEADSLFRAAYVVSLDADDALGIGNALLSLAQEHVLRGETLAADSCLLRAGRAFARAGDALGRANTSLLQADLARNGGRLREADSLVGAADAAYLAVDAVYNHCHAADIAGSIAWQRDDDSAAQAWLTEAIACYERVGNRRGAANARYSLAQIASLEGRFAAAQDCLSDALQCYTMLRDDLGRGNVLKELAELEIIAGRTGEAATYLEQAMESQQRAGNPHGQANAACSLARLTLAEGQQERAAMLARGALLLYRDCGAATGIGAAHLLLSDIASAAGDVAVASAHLDSARRAYLEAQQFHGLAHCWMNASALRARELAWESAAACLDSAAALFRASSDRWSLSQVQQRRARLFANRGDIGAARTAFLDAVRLREMLRGNLAREDARRSYLSAVAGVYQEAADFLLAHGFIDDAWRVVELLHARVFAEQLAARRSGVARDDDAGRGGRLDSLYELRGSLEMHRERSRSLRERDSLLRLMLRCDSADAAIRAEIHAANAGVAAAPLAGVEPVTLARLRTVVLRRGEALLEYLVTDSTAWVFLVRPDTVRILALPAGSGWIEQAASQQAAAHRGIARMGDAYGAMDTIGGQLFRVLLEPLLPSLRDVDRLIIVPDGDLALLSFDAMLPGERTGDGREEYLIDRYLITFAQSSTVLDNLRALVGRRREPRLLAVGDPVYELERATRGDARTDDRPPSNLQLQRLPYSGREIAAVADLFPVGGSTVLSRERATEDTITHGDWRDCTHVLLSCHGMAGRRYNWLAFSAGQAGTTEDGLLHWQEAMRCRFDAELVVLSACQTALGERERGEGVTGLMRAVQCAGSRAVAGTLWSVSDPATEAFVVAMFHRMLRDGFSPPVALRAVKREFATRTDAWRHPYYWSAFVYYGD